MNKKQNILLGAAIAFFASNMASQAAQAMMVVTGDTTQPIGHYEFCQRYPVECRTTGGKGSRVALTKSTWKQLVEINSAVNSQVRPRTDLEMWGKEEVWSFPVREGDCEDYALLKRRTLVKSGFPESSLLITVVRQPDGSGHAVLTVATDRGDFVLDNLNGSVRLWSETEYRFLKRQSQSNPGQWVGIEDRRAVQVASSS